MSGTHDTGSGLADLVLIEPEIPNNTGSIARTCVAFGLGLHLVHPLGFDIDEKACRRAGLDYWPRVRLTEHTDLDAYRHAMERAPGFWLFTARASTSVYDIPIGPGDHLVFGRESVGLPRELLDAYPDRCVSIPLMSGERSLNVSNAAAIASSQVIQRALGCGNARVDAAGRLERVF
ncbi:MAG: tRNA (cytidine(34)-2'-O)-methyltransferase [Planctomycetota bacterium]